jgi:hypothetical protein
MSDEITFSDRHDEPRRQGLSSVEVLMEKTRPIIEKYVRIDAEHKAREILRRQALPLPDLLNELDAELQTVYRHMAPIAMRKKKLLGARQRVLRKMRRLGLTEAEPR